MLPALVLALGQYQNLLQPPQSNLAQPTNLFQNVQGNPSGQSSNLVQYGAVAKTGFGRAPGRLDHRRRGSGFQIGVGDVRSPFQGGYRYGYVHYRQDWRDSYFSFGAYLYNPYAAPLVCPSPWYAYPSLPPYIDGGQVVYGQPLAYGASNPYRWGSLRALDRATRRIVEVFRTGDENVMESLVPEDEDVDIRVNGAYQYTLTADQFLDLFRDGVINVRTTGYRITGAFVGDGFALVNATHFYLDPWGAARTAQHRYILEPDGRRWYVVEFGAL